MRKSVMINENIRERLDKIKVDLDLNTDAKALIVLLELYERSETIPKEVLKLFSSIK